MVFPSPVTDGLSGDCPRCRQPTAALIQPPPLVVAAFVLLVADASATARPGQCPISALCTPDNAGRFHAHLGDLPAAQPVRQGQQLLAGGPERAGLLLPAAAPGITGHPDGDLDPGLGDADPGGAVSEQRLVFCSCIIAPTMRRDTRSRPSAGAAGQAEIWSAGSKHQVTALKSSSRRSGCFAGSGPPRQHDVSGRPHPNPRKPPRMPHPCECPHECTALATARQRPNPLPRLSLAAFHAVTASPGP